MNVGMNVDEAAGPIDWLALCADGYADEGVTVALYTRRGENLINLPLEALMADITALKIKQARIQQTLDELGYGHRDVCEVLRYLETAQQQSARLIGELVMGKAVIHD